MEDLEHVVLELHSASSAGHQKAAEALRQRGVPGGQIEAEALLHLLLHDPVPLRTAAATILREWREYVPIEPLLLAMQDANMQVRRAAAWTLADVGASADPERLLAHLADPDPTVRAAVLSALGTRTPITSVLEAISASDEDVREVAVSLVALLAEQIPVEPLISMVQTGDAHLRVTAARALGTLGTVGTHAPAEPLLAALSTSDASVRQAVAAALYITHPEILPALVPELVATLCSGHAGPLLEPLRHVLLVRALATLRSPLPALLACLDRSLDAPHWEVRLWAAQAWSGMTPGGAAPLAKLQHLLNDPDSASVRHAARCALDHLMPPSTQ